MKKIDVLITFLVIMLFVSGGVLGYSVYQSVTNNQANPKTTNDIAQNDMGTLPVTNTCTDADNDGYGQDCDKGPDCDDNDNLRNEICKTVNEAILLVADKDVYEVGEEVLVTVSMQNLESLTEPSVALNLRLDYNNSILEYEGREEATSKYSLPIDLVSPNKVKIDFVTNEDMASGEEVVTLKFKAIATGAAKISVSDDARVGFYYQVVGGDVDVLVQ